MFYDCLKYYSDSYIDNLKNDFDEKIEEFLVSKYTNGYEKTWRDICKRISVIGATCVYYHEKLSDIQDYHQFRQNLFYDLYTNRIILNDNGYRFGSVSSNMENELNYNERFIQNSNSKENRLPELYYNYSYALIHDKHVIEKEKSFIIDKLDDTTISQCYSSLHDDKIDSIVYNLSKAPDLRISKKPVIYGAINLLKFLKIQNNSLEFDYSEFTDQIQRLFLYLSGMVNITGFIGDLGIGIVGIKSLKSLFNNDNLYLLDNIFKNVCKYLINELTTELICYIPFLDDLELFGLKNESISDYMTYNFYAEFIETFKGYKIAEDNKDKILSYSYQQFKSYIFDTYNSNKINQIIFTKNEYVKIIENNNHNKNECKCDCKNHHECDCKNKIDLDTLEERLKSDQELYNKVFSACVNSKRPSIVKSVDELTNPSFAYGMGIEQNTPFGWIYIYTKYDNNNFMRQVNINIMQSSNKDIYEYQSLLNSIATLISVILQFSNENTKELLNKLKIKLFSSFNGKMIFDYKKYYQSDDVVEIIQSKSLIDMIINTLIDINNSYNKEE